MIDSDQTWKSTFHISIVIVQSFGEKKKNLILMVTIVTNSESERVTI